MRNTSTIFLTTLMACLAVALPATAASAATFAEAWNDIDFDGTASGDLDNTAGSTCTPIPNMTTSAPARSVQILAGSGVPKFTLYAHIVNGVCVLPVYDSNATVLTNGGDDLGHIGPIPSLLGLLGAVAYTTS